jgi:DNA-binding PadR family transcriptional regulator
MKELSTTSYVILGLLGVRPFTAYELARQMQRAVRFYWPRAERKLYEEPKNLVAHGLARARPETTGRRPRTVYTITPKGRGALRRWLSEPSAPAAMEFEGMMKVFFAEQGSKEQLLAGLRTIAADADAVDGHLRALARENVEVAPPYPERLHVLALTFRFHLEYAALVRRWADWAEERVSQWPDTTPSDTKRDEGLAVYREALSEPSVPRAGRVSP